MIICAKTFICLYYLNENPLKPTAKLTFWYSEQKSSQNKREIQCIQMYKSKSSHHR